MKTWFESVHSDGTAAFVSNPSPNLFENVEIRIRMYDTAPVKHVILRYMPNGMERLEEMQISKREQGFVYYAITIKVTENRMPYHFYLVCISFQNLSLTKKMVSSTAPDLNIFFISELFFVPYGADPAVV